MASVNEVLNETPISINVEEKFIKIAIIDSQLIELKQVIGSNLYRKIEDLIADGSITASTQEAYKTLLDEYISPAIIKNVLKDILMYVSFKVNNKGVMQQSSENSTLADLDTIKFLEEKFKNKAEYMFQRLSDYLIANTNLYPEFLTIKTNDDIIPANGGYTCGIYLGNTCSQEEYLRGKTGRNDIG